MKFLALLAIALQGANAFPAVLSDVIERAALEARAAGQSGCSTSAKCNQKYDVSDAQIGYNANAPTAAQKASAARQNCGGVNVCTTFDATEQLGETCSLSRDAPNRLLLTHYIPSLDHWTARLRQPTGKPDSRPLPWVECGRQLWLPTTQWCAQHPPDYFWPWHDVRHVCGS